MLQLSPFGRKGQANAPTSCHWFVLSFSQQPRMIFTSALCTYLASTTAVLTSCPVSCCKNSGSQHQPQTPYSPRSSPLPCRPTTHGTARPTAGARGSTIYKTDIPGRRNPVLSLLLSLSPPPSPSIPPHPSLFLSLSFSQLSTLPLRYTWQH